MEPSQGLLSYHCKPTPGRLAPEDFEKALYYATEKKPFYDEHTRKLTLIHKIRIYRLYYPVCCQIWIIGLQ